MRLINYRIKNGIAVLKSGTPQELVRCGESEQTSKSRNLQKFASEIKCSL